MSAKTRLFLTIERLKNAMDDAQMSFPFWEQFFPLMGDAQTVSVDLGLLSDLINEAAEAAERIIVTQSGAIYSQYLYGGQAAAGAGPAVPQLPPRVAPVPQRPGAIDPKRYAPFAEKVMNHFVSAGTSAVSFAVKDVVKLYVYTSHLAKYKKLFDFLENILFRKEKECMPTVAGDQTTVLLDALRDLTGITNIRLDYESLLNVNTSIQRAVNGELSRFPQVKVRDYITNVNVYEKEADPCKAYVDKFQLLLGEKTRFLVEAKSNAINFARDPAVVEAVAASLERTADMNRMVFNAINNIFINTVEQSAAENIKFDAADYNRRFRAMDRAREKSRNNLVEKAAVGDVVPRKRSKTASTGADIKRYKSAKFPDEY